MGLRHCREWRRRRCGLGFAPAVDADSSARALMQQVAARIGPEAELGMVGWREQHLLQADREVANFGFKNTWQQQWRQATPWLLAQPQRRWLFVAEEALGRCVDRGGTIAIGQSNRKSYVLVNATAVNSKCATSPSEQGPARAR